LRRRGPGLGCLLYILAEQVQIPVGSLQPGYLVHCLKDLILEYAVGNVAVAAELCHFTRNVILQSVAKGGKLVLRRWWPTATVVIIVDEPPIHTAKTPRTG